MKTLLKTKQPAYKERLQKQKTTKQLLIQHLEISEEKYNLFQFDMGCALVEDFFKDMAYTKGIRNKLLFEHKHGYWPWFQCQWDAFEKDFWAANKWIVLEKKEPRFFTVPGDDEKTLLHNSWKCEMALIAKVKEMHERLHHHIVQTNIVLS